MKICFRCFTVIPALASRCPNCLYQRQGAWGRIFLLVLAAVATVWMFKRCADRQWPFDKPTRAQQTDQRREGTERGMVTP